MVKAKAVSFKNSEKLSQELKQLNQAQELEMAIIADFNAVTESGAQYDLSCFIELKNDGFDIAEVLAPAHLDLNISNLKFDLMAQELTLA